MQNTRPYEKLKFYQDICEIRKFIYPITERFKKTHPRLASQMQDAARSAKQNIREGYRKGSLGEFIHSIKISQGSLEELSGDVEDCKEDGLMNEEEFVRFSRLYQSAGYLTARFLKSLYKIEREGSWRVPGAKLRIKNTATLRSLTQPYVASRNLTQGAALIIVIFAMMLFAILGWTLMNLQSGDFEMNLQNLNSEQALHLADAGTQWALNKLSNNFNCTNIAGVVHNLSPGQYDCNCTSSGNSLTVITTGYVPSQANYRAMRQVNLTLTQGGFSTSAAGGNRFDWHNTSGYTVNIQGTIASPNFEGRDANTVVNEAADTTIPGGANATVGPTSIPAINMTYFLSNADILYNTSQVFTTDQKNKGLVYVKGNITFSTGTTGNGLNCEHSSFVAEGNITITGTKSLTMKAHVKPSNQETFPDLATQYGNITSSAPSGDQARDRDFNGLIYTQYGTIDFNCIQLDGGLMGVNIYLRRNIDIQYDGKYVDNTGFNLSGNLSSTTWQEQ